MTADEIITLIGELILTEIDDVNRVDYKKGNDEFTIVMENGKRFAASIKEIKKNVYLV